MTIPKKYGTAVFSFDNHLLMCVPTSEITDHTKQKGFLMKIAFTKKVISPKVGTKVAGYGTDDVSMVKLDDLYLTVLAGKPCP